MWARMQRRCLAIGALIAMPLMAQPRWIHLNTTHFEMYSNTEEKTARDAIRYFERVREFFLMASPVRPPKEFPTRIIAFRDETEFRMYSRPSVEAFYAPGPVRDVIAMGNPSAENYPVAIHEYFHLVVRHSGLRIPVWLNEGWAEVYSTMKPVRDGVAVGDLIPRHMKWLETGGWFTLSHLGEVTHDSPEYNETGRIGMFYAQSWALTHMLYLSPEYKDNFRKFLAALNRGQSMNDALQASFGKNEDQVLADLKTYFNRKKLFGTVFLTPFERTDEIPQVSGTDSYETRMMLADLFMSSGHLADAIRSLKELEKDEPLRPDAFESSGYLALETKDKETARMEFSKALALGTNDAQLCMQLAALDREAKQPIGVIINDLTRAVKLRPDFGEAAFELGILKVETRDFPTALSLLSRVTAVAPERAAIFHSALAYSELQTGNLDAARAQVEELRKAAKTAPETQGAERLAALIEARSKGPAAAKSGEKLVRVEGTALGLRCEAAATGKPSKLGVNVGGKQMLFDMPDAAALEIAKQAGSTVELKCGPLPGFHIAVEYVPGEAAKDSVVAVTPANPAALLAQPATGLIRRLEF